MIYIFIEKEIELKQKKNNFKCLLKFDKRKNLNYL